MTLADRFERFARNECRGSSPAYERLSMAVAGDPELQALAAETQPGQPPPNLLFAAMRYLARRAGVADPLTVDAFRAFCLDRRDAVKALVSTRRVQTNEIRRSALLLPAIELVARRAGPLAVIDVGASAGLNLLWDRYAYDYAGRRCGDEASAVRIDCVLEGDAPLPSPSPRVIRRVGVDIEPVDLADADTALWMRSLIWPEHTDREALFDAAVRIWRSAPPRVIRGDGLELVPSMLEGEGAPCVMHSHALYQLTEERQRRFTGMLAESSRGRVIYRISLEMQAGATTSELTIYTYEDGVERREFVAHGHPHGRWMRWI